MKNKGLVATIVIMSGVIVTLLVILFVIKMPSIVPMEGLDKFVEKTEASHEEETVPTTEIETTEEKNVIMTHIKTYTGYNDHVSIEYPEISGMSDTELQERLNHKIRTNALSIVPLYPISTALQNLDIYSEVKYLDDNYITIIYTGSVVGSGVKSGSATNLKNNTTTTTRTNNNVNSNDPYLDGFVDPLGNSVNNNNIGLPLPKAKSPDTVYDTPVNISAMPQNNVSIAQTTTANDNYSYNSHINRDDSGKGTVDSGPTITEIKAPTAKSKSQSYIQEQSQVIVPNSSGASSFPGDNANVQTGAPIYSYTGTNISASTIDQKIFYTNTIDLKNCLDVTLRDFGDVETMAKFARSSDVVFDNVDSSKRTEVRNYIKKTILSTLTEQLYESDFRNADLKTWPKHFSYKDADGTIHFSIKLSSKLGNYAIVRYKPQ